MASALYLVPRGQRPVHHTGGAPTKLVIVPVVAFGTAAVAKLLGASWFWAITLGVISPLVLWGLALTTLVHPTTVRE